MRSGATLTQGRRGGNGGAGMVSTGGRTGAATVAPDRGRRRTLCAHASDDGRDGGGLSSGARVGARPRRGRGAAGGVPSSPAAATTRSTPPTAQTQATTTDREPRRHATSPTTGDRVATRAGRDRDRDAGAAAARPAAHDPCQRRPARRRRADADLSQRRPSIPARGRRHRRRGPRARLRRHARRRRPPSPRASTSRPTSRAASRSSCTSARHADRRARGPSRREPPGRARCRGPPRSRGRCAAAPGGRRGARARRPPGPADPALALRRGARPSCSSCRSSRSPSCGASRCSSRRASAASSARPVALDVLPARSASSPSRSSSTRASAGTADRRPPTSRRPRSTSSSGSACRSSALLLGDVFRAFNPWRAIARAARGSPRRVARRAAARAAGLPGLARPLARGRRHPGLRVGRARLPQPRRPEHAGHARARVRGRPARGHEPLRRSSRGRGAPTPSACTSGLFARCRRCTGTSARCTSAPLAGGLHGLDPVPGTVALLA